MRGTNTIVGLSNVATSERILGWKQRTSMDPNELERGTTALVDQLTKLQESDPEISDLHDAFEQWSRDRYSLGDASSAVRTGAGGDLGVDFYSVSNREYCVGQCKVPERDFLEANPTRIKSFGTSAVDDPRSALAYLLKDDKKLRPNEAVKALYAQIVGDREDENFRLDYHLVVWGRLNTRAQSAWDELKAEWDKAPHIRLHLHEIEELVEELLVGSKKPSEKVIIDLRYDGIGLKAQSYRYVLVKAGDIFQAFKDYGWRLFDLNLRYEIKNSPINGQIVETLKHAAGRRRFHHYNNGLIIVCKQLSDREREGKLHIVEAQIVNGLQTVKSIYNAVANGDVKLDDLDKQCLVQVKIIQDSDPEFIAGIARATNNQNPMKPRNLCSNDREQKLLRTALSELQPRWFLQSKEGEWDSLSGEGSRFFKDVVHYPPSEFRVVGVLGRPRNRVIDNEGLAKAWLAVMGFADYAGDRTTHFFSVSKVYDMAYKQSPSDAHWVRFADQLDFRDAAREDALARSQGKAYQYLLAFYLLELIKAFVPSPTKYRELGLNEGVRDGKIQKSSGQIVSPVKEQDEYLASNSTYQTYRLMANMKELLLEVAAHLLCRRYGPLKDETCKQLLSFFDARDFLSDADARPLAQRAFDAADLNDGEVFARIMAFLKWSAQQFWEEKQKSLLAVSRIRTLLLGRDIARDFKKLVTEQNDRKGLSRSWKREGVTFIDSLPALPSLGK